MTGSVTEIEEDFKENNKKALIDAVSKDPPIRAK